MGRKKERILELEQEVQEVITALARYQKDGQRIQELEAEALKFYHADGNFEKLASKKEVIARRIQCADRLELMTDLLSSAHAIAKRKGRGTDWELFSRRLNSLGISPVTAKTFSTMDEKPDK